MLADPAKPATAGDTNYAARNADPVWRAYPGKLRPIRTAKREQLNPEGPAELVLDKGYHSNDVLCDSSERSRGSELLFRTGPRTPELDRAGRREVSGAYQEPTADQRRARKAACRQRGEQSRTEASPICTKPEPCEEYLTGGTISSSNGCSFMRGCVQSWPGDAENIGIRNLEASRDA